MVIIPKVDAKVTLLFVLEKSCSKYRKDLFVLQRGILSFNMMVIPKATWITQKRGCIIKRNYDTTSMIFSENLFPGINIDIQFMSDKIYAYSIAEAHGLGIIFSQDKKDAYKMYQHDSLIPNNTGGLHDMEDATFGELNKRGMYRSIALANKLYEKYQRGEYFLWPAQNKDSYEIHS